MLNAFRAEYVDSSINYINSSVNPAHRTGTLTFAPGAASTLTDYGDSIKIIVDSSSGSSSETVSYSNIYKGFCFTERATSRSSGSNRETISSFFTVPASDTLFIVGMNLSIHPAFYYDDRSYSGGVLLCVKLQDEIIGCVSGNEGNGTGGGSNSIYFTPPLRVLPGTSIDYYVVRMAGVRLGSAGDYLFPGTIGGGAIWGYLK